MENNNIDNYQTKYNPLKDPSFWIAFVLGGGPILLILLTGGFALTTPTILNIIFLISWEAWIIIKKGKKWSLVVGFIIAAVITGVAFFPAMKVDKKNRMEEQEKRMEEFRKNIQLDIEKFKSEKQEDNKNNQQELNRLDRDNDGLSDKDEASLGTSPLSADSDNDGLTDSEEVNIYKTNPMSVDTDGDGFWDGDEVKSGHNPNGEGDLK